MTTASGPPAPLLDVIGNLAEFHREHEKFYAQDPLHRATEIEGHSRALKALADWWSEVAPSDHPAASPFAGARDLNPPGLTAQTGVLFMEGEGEPAEIGQLKRDLRVIAADMEGIGNWLSAAMEKSWTAVGSLADYPELADLLGERHRIVANDWQAANLQVLISRLIARALDLLERVDFAPAALREDLTSGRRSVAYLYSASELLDRAADLIVESATLVHDNERRWRVFGDRVRELARANT
jgi:hypothetical protein